MRKAKIFIPAVLCLALLSGCMENGGKDTESTNAANPDLAGSTDCTFKVNTSLVESGGIGSSRSFCADENGVFYTIAAYQTFGDEMIVSLKGILISPDGEVTKKEIYRSNIGYATCEAIGVNKNGNISALISTIGTGDDDTLFFREYNPDFELLSETAADKSVIEEIGAYNKCRAIDGEFYFMCGDSVYVFGEDYSPKGYLDIDFPPLTECWYDIRDIEKGSDGKVYIFYYGSKMDESFSRMVKINRETMKSEAETELDPQITEMVNGYVSGDENYLFYCGDQNYLYGVNKDGGLEKILSWFEAGITSQRDYFCFGVRRGDGICYLYTDYAGETKQYFVSFEKVPKSVMNSRKELTVTVTGMMQEEFERAAAKFNRENEEYRLKVDVIQYTDRLLDDFDAAILSGNVGDIIIPPENNFKYSSKGLYADYHQIPEAEEYISGLDFFPNVLAAMEDDEGHLYDMWTSFGIDTLEAPDNIIAAEEYLTYEKMQELVNEKSGRLITHFPNEMTDSSNFLRLMLKYNFDYFVDTKTGKCNFKSEAMRTALETAKQAPGAVPEDFRNEDFKDRFINGKGVLCYGDIYDMDKLNHIRDGWFGGLWGVNFVGYPSADGRRLNVLDGRLTTVCISAASEYKAGAWEYVKTVIETENHYGFSTIESVFDSDVEKKLAEYAERNNDILMVAELGGKDVGIKAPTAEEFAMLKRLIADSLSVTQFDDHVMNIVIEEAQSYFAGDKTVEEVMDIIQRRAEMYCSENMV